MEYSQFLKAITRKLTSDPEVLESRGICPESMRGRRKSAVCIGFWKDSESGQVHVLFVKKSQGLGQHSGQFAFPGGKVEENESYLEAAVRELREETGYSHTANFLGFLPTIPTISSPYLIVPCVFELDAGAAHTYPSDPEIVWTFSVQVECLRMPKNRKPVIYRLPEGGQIEASDFYISKKDLLFFKSRSENRQADDEVIQIWGATAYLLNMLF